MKFDRDIFYGRYRSVFGKLTESQVQGLNAMLEFAENDSNFDSIRQLAYAFATVQRETNVSETHDGKKVLMTFNPIYEQGRPSYFLKYDGNKNLGNNQKGDGFLYRGRGYVQITGRRNYTEFQKLLEEQLVTNPDLALTPKIAWLILSIGMRDGIYIPGETLDKYIPKDDRKTADYFNARKIVNRGEVRKKPEVVKEMAQKAVQWEAILRAAFIKAEEHPAENNFIETISEILPDETSENPFDFVMGKINGIHFPDNGDTATVTGEIGGESQAIYVTHFQKGAKLTIEIKSDLNAAGFSVSNRSFETVDFGKDSNSGKKWTAEIPESGAYYISVVGHSDDPDAPSAFAYSLTVTME